MSATPRESASLKLSFDTERRTHTDYIITCQLLSEVTVRAWRNRETAVVYDACLDHYHPQLMAEFLRLVSPKGVLRVNGGESLKDLDEVARILGFVSAAGLPKHGLLIAVGGGTVCDAVSLAATLYRRGISLALVPTTLLGLIDAGVGGKNGVNFDGAKNLLGHFYHPESVVCDPGFIRTLPNREYVGGIAEAIKVLAVSNSERFMRNFGSELITPDALSTEALSGLVADAVEIKLALLAEDPFELSSRRLLNYGHAFAHSFEEKSCFRLSHGEAVLLGMTVENAISLELGFAGPEIEALQQTITALMTDGCREHWIDRSELPILLGALRRARRNFLNLVCLRRIGHAEIINDVETVVMLAAWDRSTRIVMESQNGRSNVQTQELAAFASLEVATENSQTTTGNGHCAIRARP